MELNRDKALKAKEIAEGMFAKNDIVGATRFALIAQILFPALDGINQMIMTLNVYLASEKKVCGEKDLYAILGLNSYANEDTLKKQYIMMAIQLHPNKNRSVGAQGAFKLLSEAWNTLSDVAKKMAYDQKIKSERPEKEVFQPTTDNFVSDNANGFYKFSIITESETRDPMSNSITPSTFWTSCEHCKMQYEYDHIFIDQDLLCANCRQPFLAKEIGRPINEHVRPWPFQQKFLDHGSSTSRNNAVPNVRHEDNANSFGNQDLQCPYFSLDASVAGVTSSASPAAQATFMVHEASQNDVREDEEALATTKRDVFHTKMNFLKRKFGVLENIDAGSSESLLTKKRTSISDIIQDENICLFTGLNKTSEMGKVNEAFNHFSKSSVCVTRNFLGGESSQMDIQNTSIEKKSDEEKMKESKVDEDNEETTNEAYGP